MITTRTGQVRRPLGRAMGAVVAALAIAATGLAGCSSDGGSQAAFCAQVRKVQPLEVLLAGFTEADPVELARRLDTGAAAYADLLDASPGEVRGDVRQVVELVDEVIAAVRAHRNDPEAAAAQVRAAVADHPKAAESTTAVAAHAKDRCGVDLNPTVVDDPSTGSTTTTESSSTTTEPSTTTTTGVG